MADKTNAMKRLEWQVRLAQAELHLERAKQALTQAEANREKIMAEWHEFDVEQPEEAEQ